jgi:hypothetical protein
MKLRAALGVLLLLDSWALPTLAAGGGPLILIVGTSSLLLVQPLLLILKPLLWIVSGRRVPLKRLYLAYFSGIVVAGVAIPLVIAALSILPSMLSSGRVTWAAIAGTWVYEGMANPRSALASLAVWWVLLGLVAVGVERKVLERSGVPRANGLVVLDVAVTFASAALLAAFIWRDLLPPLG